MYYNALSIKANFQGKLKHKNGKICFRHLQFMFPLSLK